MTWDENRKSYRELVAQLYGRDGGSPLYRMDAAIELARRGHIAILNRATKSKSRMTRGAATSALRRNQTRP